MTNDAQQFENTRAVAAAPAVTGGFDLRDRPKFPLMFGLGCLAVLTLSFSFSHFFPSAKEHLHITFTLLAAVAGVTTFLYAQHAQDIQLFRELFREFNARYAALNDGLNEIRNRPTDQQLKNTDHDVLCAYFNLCAEEYMYATAGYIDSRVCRAWRNGMRYFDKDPEIHDFWECELQQGSYYGFTLEWISRTEPKPKLLPPET
jgi:hypothetical protein